MVYRASSVFVNACVGAAPSPDTLLVCVVVYVEQLWGEDGFIRLFRAKDGEPEPCSPAQFGKVCGTSGCLNQLQYPIVFEATPTKFG